MTQFSDPYGHAADHNLSVSMTDSLGDLGDLPPADTKRWVVRRKEQVVQAVQTGRLSRAQACERYRLSEEEYGSWEAHLSSHGVRGLRVTRLQDYRRHSTAEKAKTQLHKAGIPRNPHMLAREEA